ncbi:MAG TPA: alanine racemase [Blastocatellia bacterium]|jgi:D-serine deaminase-like pyridoxal phosphate-dependent protein|nr:alanine racemase [Blastocatellia bacterium]
MTAPPRVSPISELSESGYRIDGIERVLTPALAIYPEHVDANIAITLGLLGGDTARWRPHVKTAKLAWTMRRMVERGVVNFKCATTRELATVCGAGAEDVLLGYPAVGANARRVRELAGGVSARISALVEHTVQIEAWKGSNVGLFIDINPGMDRTGIQQGRVDDIVKLVGAIEDAGLVFRGLHYYDGHLSNYDLAAREKVAHRGYDRLMDIISAVERSGFTVEEVGTSGTPAFPCAVSYRPFRDASFIHRASPGTVIYNDCSSLALLSQELGYRPAALVVSTVVSLPSPHRLTCDAGHKTVSADSGVPTCAVLGRPDLLPGKPSEEHLPIEALDDLWIPAMGDALYLVPMHVCPTVNNFDDAILVEEGRITGMERVTARGRESPLVNG